MPCDLIVKSIEESLNPGYDRDCNGTSNSGRANYLTFIDNVQDIAGIHLQASARRLHSPAVTTGSIQKFPLPSIPTVTFTVLHIAKGACKRQHRVQLPDQQRIHRADAGDRRAAFTGDANGKERDEEGPGTPGHIEKKLLDLESSPPGTLKADVIKGPQHGSETANSQAFIDKVDPKFVVISASTSHHLPRHTVVHRYMAPLRTILRTDDSAVFNNGGARYKAEWSRRPS